MPSDRQRDYVDAVEEWRRQQDEGGWLSERAGWRRVSERADGWRVDERVDGVLRTTVRDLTPEERDALTVPAGALDHYRQDPPDPATLGLDALMVRVAEGRISPRDASAIVTREMADVAVAGSRGWELFYVMLASHGMIVAMNANVPWFVRLLAVGAICACVVRVYRIRQSRRSLEK